MVITNVYDLPNAKLSVQLEQLDPDLPLNDEDVATAEIFWGAFKRVVEARLRSQKRDTKEDSSPEYGQLSRLTRTSLSRQ